MIDVVPQIHPIASISLPAQAKAGKSVRNRCDRVFDVFEPRNGHAVAGVRVAVERDKIAEVVSTVGVILGSQEIDVVPP